MTHHEPSAPGDRIARTPTPRFWLTDGRGYWRDEVLKDFVKYAVQVGAGLYVAIVLRLIPSGDTRTRIAVVIAVTLYLVAALTIIAVTWLPHVTTSAVLLSASGLWLALILIVRADVDNEWIWWALVGMGVLYVLNLFVLGVADVARAVRAGGWRRSGRPLLRMLAGILGVVVGGAAVAYVLMLID